MTRHFELLIFDWDGTLADSTGIIARAMQAACRDLGWPEPSDERARYVIGLDLPHTLRHIAPDAPGDALPSFTFQYRRRYLEEERNIRLFAGIPELIAKLHAAGYRLAVATGKRRDGLDRALVQSGLSAYFSASRSVDECPSKPHPRMIEELMAEFSVPAARTLMIGDTTHDMRMALNAGVAGLAVTYGAHPRDELARLNPLACVEDVARLAPWLENYSP